MIYYTVNSKKERWKESDSVPSNAKFATILDTDGDNKFKGKLYFDLDGELDEAFEETKVLVDILDSVGCDPEVYFSGKKGFHVLVKLIDKHTENLPRIYKYIAEDLCKGFKTLDKRVYSGKRGRLLRLVGTQHEDTGNFKVGLDYKELSSLSIETIINRSKSNVNYEHESTKVSEKLMEKFSMFQSIVQNKLVFEEMEGQRSFAYKGEGTYIPPCIEKVCNNEGISSDANFNSLTMLLATFFKNYPETASIMAEKMLKERHSNSYPTYKQRKEHLDYMSGYAKESGYTFSCSFARSVVDVNCSTCKYNNISDTIFTNGNAYYKSSGKVPKKLTNFIIEPTHLVKNFDTGELAFKGILRSEDGSETHFDNLPTRFFKKKADFKLFIGVKHYFVGVEDDLDIIGASLMVNYSLDILKEVDCYGLHKFKGEWYYLEKAGAVNKNMHKSYNIVPSRQLSESSDFRSQISTAKQLKDSEKHEIVENIMFNEPNVVVPVLGWIGANYLRPRLADIDKKRFMNFPILTIFGNSGAGKSETAKLMNRFFGNDDPLHHFANTTWFVKESLLKSSNLAPVAFDEIKKTLGRDMEGQIANLIREVYGSSEGGKGTKDQRILRYKRRASMCLAGEQLFIEKAILDRELICQMDSDSSEKHEPQYEALKDMNLEGVGREMLFNIMNVDNESIEVLIKSAMAKLTKYDLKTDDRRYYNLLLMTAGLSFISNILNMSMDKELDNYIEFYMEFCRREYDQSSDTTRFFEILERACTDPTFTTSKDPKTDMKDCMRKKYLLYRGVRYDYAKGFLYLDNNFYFHGYLTKYIKDYGMQFNLLDHVSLRNILVRESYYHKPEKSENTIRMEVAGGKKPTRTIMLDLKKMELKGIFFNAFKEVLGLEF